MSYLQSPVSPGSGFEFPDVSTTKKWTERNDRQLRLWGIHGQDRIDEANVLLLHATAVGSEVLKNIVLPGFGKFTIVDGAKVTERDLGKNFYVTKDSIGKDRAQIVCECLTELNPDVEGEYLVKNPEDLIKKNKDFFKPYNYVIASNMNTTTLALLSKICWQLNSVLLVCRSYGLIGYIRIVVQSHEIFEAKLDNPKSDLRICDPWKELQDFVDTQDLSKMNSSEHAHCPFIVILIKLLNQWKSKNNGKIPKTDDEKNDFTKLVTSSSLNLSKEENFQEALSKIFWAWQTTQIPDEVKQVLNDPRAQKLTKSSKDYWFLVNGVKKFVENEGKGYLPLEGKVPDMFSDTLRYIAVQKIYHKKSRDDMKIVKKYVRAELKKVGRDPDSINAMYIKEFCKNSQNLRVFTFSSIEEELNPEKANLELIAEEFMDPDSNIIFYFLLRAVDAFFDKNGYYPGEKDDADLKADTKGLLSVLNGLLKAYKVEDTAFELEDYCVEMVRYGAGEIHNISSLIGGVAAQELIKLCTQQRLPIYNTWVYNGIKSVSQCLKL